jgi:HK97 family phage portal protein
MFKKVFGRNPSFTRQDVEMGGFVSLNQSVNILQAAGEDNYKSLFVRVCVDSIAENAAKLKPKVMYRKTEEDSPLQRLLEISPNEYMNSYDFLYKVVTCWLLDNNSFIFIKRNNETGKIEGLYPINYSDCQFVEHGGELFVRFTFMTGFRMAVAYTDLCHLRRFFGKSDLFGESNDETLKGHVGLLNIVHKGLAAAVNSNNKLRGLIKLNMNLKNEDVKAAQEQFVKDYMNLNNVGGIAALDSRMDYIELKNNPTVADDAQMKLLRNDVMQYFHVNEAILMSKYNEDEWNAFYESVVEPIAIRLGLELTRKIFTPNELAFGNRIVFEANRLQYMSSTSKINLLKEMMPFGIFNVDEGREIFNMAPLPNGAGKRRLQSLNFVNYDKADDYQEVGNQGKLDVNKQNGGKGGTGDGQE